MGRTSPVRRLATSLLQRTGRSYVIDPRIPSGYLLAELVRRGIQLCRGLVRGLGPVFLGRAVRLRGRSRIRLAKGVSIGDYSMVDGRGVRGLVMGRGSRLGRFGTVTTTSHLSLFGEGVTIGRNSGVGDFFHIGASGGVEIGDDVIIGPHLLIHSQEHRHESADVPIRSQGTVQDRVVIGDDCWIGSRVTLLAGSELGPRTIVASGAVVRGTFHGGVILGGVPAKIIKSI